MPEPLAIVGAVTGTTSLAVTLWRERRGVKRSLRVESGWQFVYGAEDELLDVWVCVMAYNTGRRPLHIEHVGWEILVEAPPELAEAAGVAPGKRAYNSHRFEIALNGETLEVVPDGPSVKVWTRLVPICAYGINPAETRVRPYVMTVPETYWWGSHGAIVPQTPPGRDPTQVTAAFARIVRDELDPKQMGEALPFAEEPSVIGLERLILDGDVKRASDLIGDRYAHGEGP